MRFKIGLALGLALGYWAGTQADEERKRQLEEAIGKVRDNPRVQHLSDSVSRNAAKVSDAVESRIAATADRAGETVASTADTGGSGPSTGNSP